MTLPVLAGLTALVAALYSAVGHGGASGYIAVMLLAGAPADTIATTALLLNVAVAGIALAQFAAAGHFSGRLARPFILASVPAAFVGGWLAVPARLLEVLLALTLAAAAVRLWMAMTPRPRPELAEGPSGPEPIEGPVAPGLATGAGAGIGLLSGVVGVGGGIFLSPLLILRLRTSPQRAAAVSAAFILANSAAGLAGRLAAGRFLTGPLAPLLGAALVGGLAGSAVGARRLSGLTLRRVLAVVLLAAAGRMALP